MCYWLRKFEGRLLYPLFLAYANLAGIPYSRRCSKCGRLLFDHISSRLGLCERCKREELLSNPAKCIEAAWSKRVASPRIPQSGEDIYTTIAKKVGLGKIFDVGCSQGALLSSLGTKHRELYGMDISSSAINVAKAWVKDGSFCVAEARNIPVKSNTFDYLICTQVLHYIEGNEAAKECYRVLKPGGVALITVPNGGGDKSRHIHSFTFQSFITLLQQTGFEVISTRKFGLDIPIITYLLEILSLVVGRKLPLAHPLNINVTERLAAYFFAECRKKPTELGDANKI